MYDLSPVRKPPQKPPNKNKNEKENPSKVKVKKKDVKKQQQQKYETLLKEKIGYDENDNPFGDENLYKQLDWKKNQNKLPLLEALENERKRLDDIKEQQKKRKQEQEA